jgi:hypothetical protein
MIWILSENNDLHRLKWSHIKCTKNIFSGGETWIRTVFRFYKFCQFWPVWFCKFVLQCFFPGWMDFDGHMYILEKNADLQTKNPTPDWSDPQKVECI